mmetsp:Transcript_23707/g.23469  ORF Transcript_23707/g.23469 Transcript_23707/m.23469 type:complete len:719 (-) Transcript_23707:34-2190(-)
MGELSICRYAMEQCPWNVSDNLHLDEWILYYLKPMAELSSKSAIKSNEALLEAIGSLERSIKGDFIGGPHPASADILGFAYLFQYFTGNPWMMKKFPVLGECYKKLSEIYSGVQEDLGETTAAAKPKKTVEYFEGSLKIHRNRTKVLPEEGKRNILITSALPYVNNVPHLGNIIGCVLSADVYARYCRLRGYNTVFICGTDEYGTATETKAIKEGLTPQEICDKYHAIHKTIYDWFDIDFDNFGRTSHPKQTEIAQDIFLKLHNLEELIEDDVEQSFCEHCNRFLADRFVNGTCPSCAFTGARGDQCDACGKLCSPEELIDPKCMLCNNTPVRKTSRHVFINLPKIKDRLEQWIGESSAKGKWSQNCVQTTQSWIRDGLKPRCITRDLKWGIPVPLPNFSDKVLYVWFDAPIGYISMTATHTDDWEKWWKNPDQVELAQFMGKDNIPFHTVIFPCSLIGSGDNWTKLHTISTTEYLNYEDGKFSKSNGVGVFGDNAMDTGIPNEVYRYYLLANRPEQSDTVFKWTDLAAKNNNELLPNVGNLCNRLFKFWMKLDQELGVAGELNSLDLESLNEAYQLLQKYAQEMEELKIRQALKTAMDISGAGNKYIQNSKLWELKKIDLQRLQTGLVVSSNIIRAAILALEPFIPGFCAKVYSQLSIERTPREDTLLKEVLEANDPLSILTLLSPHTRITQAVPIIKAISDEKVNQLKEKFSGRQN